MSISVPFSELESVADIGSEQEVDVERPAAGLNKPLCGFGPARERLKGYATLASAAEHDADDEHE